MNYEVKVNQIVLPEGLIPPEKEMLFISTMFGNTPSTNDYKKHYETVISFNLDTQKGKFSESGTENIDINDICEDCFSILNDFSKIDSLEEVKNFKVHKPFRSLSVGDVLDINKKLYIVENFGFSEFII